MSKQVPYLYQGVPNNDHHTFVQKCLRNIIISNLEGNQPPSWKMVIFYTLLSCHTEVGAHIFYIMGISLNTYTCRGTILFSIACIIILGSKPPYLQRDVLGITLSNLERIWPPWSQKTVIFYTLQLPNWWPYCPWCHYQDNSPNDYFYIHWYWFCDVDFPVILTKITVAKE